MTRDLVSDYGKSIESYLKKYEKQNSLSVNHLSGHELKANFRARMVDWMCEVLNIAFSNLCGDQTLFIAVALMDRYIEARKACKKPFKNSELHITGVTCMFMASKYEDVKPLLMKTVFNKIGHSKVPEDSIKNCELEILKALSFKVGAPTPYEFITSIFESVP